MGPRWATPRSTDRPTFGPAVARLASALGKPLMPWQQLVADVALEVDADTGEWAYSSVVVTVARQAGKTFLTVPMLMHRAAQLDRGRIWTTAQRRDKALERWRDLCDEIGRSSLAGRVTERKLTNHERLIWDATGSTVRPFTPNGSSMHGETPDAVLVDELWAFDAPTAEAVQGAYLPGFTTRDAQVWMTSTAGTPASAWLNAQRAAGRAAVERDDRRGLAYFEWSIPSEVGGIPVEDLDDRTALELVLEHHPARGYTLREQSITDAQRMMADTMGPVRGRAEFLRNYGNHPAETAEGAIVDAATFRRAQARDLIPEGVRVAFGIEVDTDQREAAVVAGWRDPDTGVAVTETIDHRIGTRWLAGRVAGLSETHNPAVVAVNDVGPARDTADELEAAGVDLLRVGGRDFAAACARWVDQTTATDADGQPAPTCRHDGSPQLEADNRSARRHRFSQSWDIRAGDDPIPVLRGTIMALWGADHMPDVEPVLGPFKML